MSKRTTFGCAWHGCTVTTDNPRRDEWGSWTGLIPPDDRAGWTCPKHSEAMRRLYREVREGRSDYEGPTIARIRDEQNPGRARPKKTIQ